MENVFDDYRGVIIFIIIVTILSLLFTMRIQNLNEIANNQEISVQEYYA